MAIILVTQTISMLSLLLMKFGFGIFLKIHPKKKLAKIQKQSDWKLKILERLTADC
jgi:hypothetical protein